MAGARRSRGLPGRAIGYRNRRAFNEWGAARISTSLMVVVLAAPAGLAGCAATSTYGTGEAPEMALFREMTGGLLSKDKKQGIDYQPRAPLVMPPNTDQLPPPVEAASTATDPSWPIDPSERVVARADDGNPRNDISQEEYRRLRPLSGAFGERPTIQVSGNNDLAVEREEYYRIVNRNRTQQAEFKKALADSKGLSRTDRRYLTDPPLAYREPAPTAPVEEIETGVKKKGFWRRLLPGGDS